jgi:hypothetical protein
MRHRAPTLLSRARDLTQRRGLAAGAVAVLGVSACAGLVALDGHDVGPLGDGGSVTAGEFPDLRTGTTYPDAAALETMAAERSDAAADRGDARTSPSDKVSEAAEPGVAAPAPPDGTLTPEPASPSADDGPRRSSAPTPSGASPSSPAPSAPDSSAPGSSSPSPEESGSTASTPSPAPSPGPETVAVTDVSAAGTWTVVLSSDQVASFECSLDGGAWAPCGPVATFTGLSKGRHTLAVRAVDGAGAVDQTPAELSTQMSGPLL